ncbi:phenylpyruvate tautomerase PptA (4-oxalocrotonate tautomerase family) [Streptosporangium becharense]|uniref:Phenylpyruvate tautomerase PptA (4-oxalocrotonate tautomerase family) n=1 Tax=Streptosporangium becharense TaxID=1816182 RepID=A0A7W9IIW5_9ACTN|nr:tautomerase family protein [Streptosporangium becharense]MBB2913431.1 phenylpyruvate tautomerase PptA (4-oxalocrotonate tautomerase family) [Streptosporangium becharense]MBB5821121.1 phenylpyruvate tautomerase PptA (4-oxalocrotonate tautomerase family) [Streptosporangium becharense]
MPQIKFYGRRDVWSDRRQELSDTVHGCLVDVWRLPQDKRFHRFLLLDPEDMICSQRGERYVIVEILGFTGRSDEAKRELIRALFARAEKDLGLSVDDLEVVILESPKVNWGIRGVPGDELELAYPVTV